LVSRRCSSVGRILRASSRRPSVPRHTSNLSRRFLNALHR
jgi:hypothetical protein